jgi:SAM-dependent methyltransferase
LPAASAEFDRIADLYDETRRALDRETLEGIREMLENHQCHSVLEIGVGTGRVSVPLLKSGFEITGMDISIRMMQKASEKGVPNLILAEGSKTPFRLASFDATLMAHVFHLLQDPMSVLHEAARVSKVGIFALVRKRNPGEQRWGVSFYEGNVSALDENERKILEERRERFRKIAEKYGVKWDLSQRFRNWQKEDEILGTFPPDDLKVVSDKMVTVNFEEHISRLEKGAYSSMSRMPEAMRKEVVSEMRSFAASHPERVSRPRREVYQLAMWKPQRLTN